jgi:hypothetical protein
MDGGRGVIGRHVPGDEGGRRVPVLLEAFEERGLDVEDRARRVP